MLITKANAKRLIECMDQVGQDKDCFLASLRDRQHILGEGLSTLGLGIPKLKQLSSVQLTLCVFVWMNGVEETKRMWELRLGSITGTSLHEPASSACQGSCLHHKGEFVGPSAAAGMLLS